MFSIDLDSYSGCNVREMRTILPYRRLDFRFAFSADRRDDGIRLVDQRGGGGLEGLRPL
jgi:hypothetical protein